MGNSREVRRHLFYGFQIRQTHILVLALDNRKYSAEVLLFSAIRHRATDRIFSMIIEMDYSLKIED